ncbi:hypothetical protein [Marinobacterium jannaschii]|uniref:hypothetical protein n=1 Tax=Marinobacterium jannaschii TaxID=64970 RepID=UPI0004809E78|nr:hypothetical protein [Marinobacterium jannaschii]
MLKTLKSQNAPQLGGLIMAALFIAYALSNGVESLLNFNNLLTDLAGAAVLSIVCVWFAYLLPAEWKHSLVYLRLKHSLPAHRFLTLLNRDARISKTKFLDVFPELDEALVQGAEQNAFWYHRVYLPVRDTDVVKAVHKSFLLYRDAMASMLITSLVLSGLYHWGGGLAIDLTQINGAFVTIVWVEVVLFGLAAHNCGKRIVTTAMAERLNVEVVSSSSC